MVFLLIVVNRLRLVGSETRFWFLDALLPALQVGNVRFIRRDCHRAHAATVVEKNHFRSLILYCGYDVMRVHEKPVEPGIVHNSNY